MGIWMFQNVQLSLGVEACGAPLIYELPSTKLTYPTWGKGKSSSNMPLKGGYVNSPGGYLCLSSPAFQNKNHRRSEAGQVLLVDIWRSNPWKSNRPPFFSPVGFFEFHHFLLVRFIIVYHHPKGFPPFLLMVVHFQQKHHNIEIHLFLFAFQTPPPVSCRFPIEPTKWKTVERSKPPPPTASSVS